MQYNCPFIPNPYLNLAPQQFGQQYIQPCIPSYSIPSQPDLSGRGEVLSVQYPDGSTQFYFVPTARAPACASCGPWRPPGAYRVDRVSTPIPAALFHQHYPFPVPFCDRGNVIPEFTVHPSPPPPHKVQFHNDAWTSTTDLHYFFPNLRGSPWIPKVDAQVDTPREQNDTPIVPESSRPQCFCRPNKRRSEAIQTKPHIRDAATNGVKTRSKSKSVHISEPESMSEDEPTTSKRNKKRKNNGRRKVCRNQRRSRSSKGSRKRKRVCRKYLRSGSSTNSSGSESCCCPCSSSSECDPGCYEGKKRCQTTQDSKSTKPTEVPQTDTSCKLDPNSWYGQGQKRTWHDSRRGVPEQKALKIFDDEAKVKEEHAMKIDGNDKVQVQARDVKAVGIDSEVSPNIEQSANEPNQNIKTEPESGKVCTCPRTRGKMLSFRRKKIDNTNAKIMIDVKANVKPVIDSESSQTSKGKSKNKRKGVRSGEESKCPSKQKCPTDIKESRSKNRHEKNTTNNKKIPLDSGNKNIEIASGSGTKIATQSIEQTDDCLYSHSTQGVDLPAPTQPSPPGEAEQPGPNHVRKPCAHHYHDRDNCDGTKTPSKDASSGGVCGALPWVLLEKLESVTSSVDKFLDMMQCSCGKHSDDHPLPTNGIF